MLLNSVTVHHDIQVIRLLETGQLADGGCAARGNTHTGPCDARHLALAGGPAAARGVLEDITLGTLRADTQRPASA